MWIGLYCQGQNNWFEWANGEPVLYTNWKRRVPNRLNDDSACVDVNNVSSSLLITDKVN